MFFKIGVLKHFENFTDKDLRWSLFLKKLQILRSANLIKRDFNTDASVWNLQVFSEHLFLQIISAGCSWKYCENKQQIVVSNIKDLFLFEEEEKRFYWCDL